MFTLRNKASSIKNISLATLVTIMITTNIARANDAPAGEVAACKGIAAGLFTISIAMTRGATLQAAISAGFASMMNDMVNLSTGVTGHQMISTMYYINTGLTSGVWPHNQTPGDNDILFSAQ